MGQGVRRFYDLRCWQVSYAYKKAVYDVCERTSIATDSRFRGQLEDSVAGPPAHIAEGFARFNPLDGARFVGYARASLAESQNHLLDAVDRKYITEDTRRGLHALSEAALAEVTGYLEYLQSPDALRNARRARERRIATRGQRLESREPRTANPEPRTTNPEPRTTNPEPRTTNLEPRTTNLEPRTTNLEPGTTNLESGTTNPEPRTANFEVRTEPRTRTRNQEPGTKNDA
jgi:four helix bundle protein